MKTAISVPDDTFTRLEQAARKLGVSRSEFFSGAAERWLADLEHDDLTAAINAPWKANSRTPPSPTVLIISADAHNRSELATVTVTQVATIDLGALDTRIGAVPDWLTAQVDRGLTRALALGAG